MQHVDPRTIVTIRYTNWKGETGVRRIVPQRVYFSSSEWHPEPQWIMDALDLEKGAERSFAIKDIHEWTAGGATGVAGYTPGAVA